MLGMAQDYIESFTISTDGEVSGEKWVGTFKAKTALSHREALNKDKIRRDLLGADPANNATDEARSIATVFSILGVYLVETPTWWKEKGNGLDLEDENVIMEVYSKVVDTLAKAKTARDEKVQAARDAIEKTAPAK